MNRDECFHALARHIGDAIVVAAYSSALEWQDLYPRDLNYYSTGAMGLGSSHALGLALARPERKVVVLDGDGSLLMTNPKTDFANLAKSAGYRHTHDFAELKSFEQQVGHVLSQDGPVFATLHVQKNRPLKYEYKDLYKASRRAALRKALNA
jgi:thiamine pyrophosphate-dependent acetolactate synthase large subunit-like protein